MSFRGSHHLDIIISVRSETEDVRPTRRRLGPGKPIRFGGLIGIAVLLAAWVVGSATGLLDPRTLTEPWTVVATAETLIENGRLQESLVTSGIRAALGLGLGVLVGTVLAQGAAYGHGDAGTGKRVIIEFVSANPTGPLHVGHGRQAALGDALSSLFEAQGFGVTREFYYNDAGVQIHTLATSVQARARGFKPGDAEWPESAYNGDYIADIAAEDASDRHDDAKLAAAFEGIMAGSRVEGD